MFLTPEQVCQRYSISRWTLYSWCSRGAIPFIKIRGLLRFLELDLQKWEGTSKGKIDLI